MSHKDDMDNHANQLNPQHDAYWQSPGCDGVPEDSVDVSQSIGEDFWGPAKKIAIAFIALVIIMFIYRAAMDLVFSLLVNQHLIEWDGNHEYPLYIILFDAVTGCLLLALAAIFVGGRDGVAAWLKKLQPSGNGQLVKDLAMGMAIGTVAAIGTDLIITLTRVYLYGDNLFLWLDTYYLLKQVLYLLPRLVLFTGMIALMQCYFQRETTKHYGALEGLMVAVLVYMLLKLFPYDLATLAFPLFSFRYLLMGATLGYLYLVTRSPYVPISFMVANYFIGQAYYCVIGISPLASGSYMGISAADALCIDYLLAGVLILAMIWCLSRRRFVLWPGGWQGLKASIDNVLTRLTRD